MLNVFCRHVAQHMQHFLGGERGDFRRSYFEKISGWQLCGNRFLSKDFGWMVKLLMGLQLNKTVGMEMVLEK